MELRQKMERVATAAAVSLDGRKREKNAAYEGSCVLVFFFLVLYSKISTIFGQVDSASERPCLAPYCV